MNPKDIERFWRKVRVAAQDECWTWTAGVFTGKGYGQFWLNTVGPIGAHRVSWAMHRGPVPEGQCVLHRCDNPPCVNPRHLFLGSLADNVADMVSKGRQASGDSFRKRAMPRGDGHYTRTHPERVPRGSRHHQARLTEAIVLEMRRLFAAGVTAQDLGRRFGVSGVAARNAIQRKTWRHVA